MSLVFRVWSVTILLLTGCASPTLPVNWERHIDWAKKDTGAPVCLDRYMGYTGGRECLIKGIGGDTGDGNRKCLMSLARSEAIRGQCETAYEMTLTAQCHNGKSARELRAVPQGQVCDYLKK